MSGTTYLLGLGAVWTCVALVCVFMGIARTDRGRKIKRPISEPRSLVTVLHDGAELEAAAARALRFELSADESLRRRVERYSTIAGPHRGTGAVLEFPARSEPEVRRARRTA
jgi:hypothetical protein